jgi:hypothetical protein
MKNIPALVRYTWLTYRLDQLWLPAAFWALFAIMVVLFREEVRAVNAARSFLGFALPLLAGILAAYAILDDPALELQFSTPRPAWRTVVERLGMILAVCALAALSFQVFLSILGVELSVLGGFGAIQLAWFVPCLVLIALGNLGALALKGGMAGALLAGLVWFFELIFRGWFAASAWGRYLLVFMGANNPGHPALLANEASMVGISLLFLLAAWVLLKKQERYI